MGEKTQALAIGGGEAKQLSFGPILAGPSISLRSDHVPVTFRHVPSIGFTFGFLGMRMRSHAFRATLLVNMKRWSRIPLSFRWVRLRSFTFRHAFPNSHSLFPYVPSRSHYVLSRSVREVFVLLCFFYTFLYVPDDSIANTQHHK